MIPSSDPELVFEWNPGWSNEHFAVNSRGMADQEVSLEKADGVFRIAFVGDSITANFGYLPRAEIYLNVLGRRLETDPRDVARFEVLNFAVNGYGLRQSVRMLETRALSFAPNLIIVQLCLNDPYPSNTPYKERVVPGSSRLWDFVQLRIAPDRFWARANVEGTYDDEGIANVKESMNRLAEIQHKTVPIVAVLFPYLYEEAYEQWGFGRLHKIYQDAAREAGVPLLDLYEPFKEGGFISQPPGADAIHPGQGAHELAAAEINDWLDDLGLLPSIALPAQRPSLTGPQRTSEPRTEKESP